MKTRSASKDSIRARMRSRRKAVSSARREKACARICERLLVRNDVRAAFATCGTIAVYLASPDEIDLTGFIEAARAAKVPLVAPRWNGNAYELSPLTGLDAAALREGPHGILEPRQAAPCAAPCLWLVPGLAFSRDGGRIGYGGGWYDRLLSAAAGKAVKLGVGYRFQTVDDLPIEAHDIRLDGVVDEGVSLDWERAQGGVVMGIDEAGRGPLAGGVYAAAVSLPLELAEEVSRSSWRAINDSKQLSEHERDELAEVIRTTAGCTWAVASASSVEIDRLNILRATHLAMRRAAEAAGKTLSAPTILVDGLPVSGLPYPSRNLVKGDAKSLLIAAASILAKTARDADCLRLERLYPGYGFARHKGYPTPAHLAALARLGPCSEHRRSFKPVAQMELGL